MGFGSKLNTESAVSAVQKATAEGRKRVVVHLGGEGVARVSPVVGGWSSTIEQIEDLGWQMTHFSVMEPDSSRIQVVTQAYAAFRRVR